MKPVFAIYNLGFTKIYDFNASRRNSFDNEIGITLQKKLQRCNMCLAKFVSITAVKQPFTKSVET